jgi:hypothetical protein
MTGSTGRMHGEMPVIKPPTKPMRIKVSMSDIRSRNGFGWVHDGRITLETTSARPQGPG